MTVTIDASVWIAARFADEPGYSESTDCLLEALSGGVRIALPWLAWVECVAAVARKTGDEHLAREAGRRLCEVPTIEWVAGDADATAEAAEVAAACRLRAADAMYVAVARRHGAVLVTLDREVQDRARGMARCLSPGEWLGGLS